MYLIVFGLVFITTSTFLYMIMSEMDMIERTKKMDDIIDNIKDDKSLQDMGEYTIDSEL